MTNPTAIPLNTTYVLTQVEQLQQTDPIGLVSIDDLVRHHFAFHPYVYSRSHDLDADQQAELAKECGDMPAAEYYVSELANILIKAAQQQANKEQVLRVALSGVESSSRRQQQGNQLEPQEVNPAMGLRGVSRFANTYHRPSFELDCEAIKRARMGEKLHNIELVIPFVRTFSEAATVIDILAEQGLCRGAQGLKVHLFVELPANALLAEKFLQYFDGLVVDIDVLAQFTLALDPEHQDLTYLYDEQNEAVLTLLRHSLKAAEKAGKPCEVVSRHLDDSPKLVHWLHEQGVSQVIKASYLKAD
ncbi:phosphoenolpyruvate-utilizing protein [Photobacterium jeanii]|uniref:Phosphoenolpyruvate-utilizing protein n=1 Tax=Photobacterium jeanii TaxID=858640 RepID=A0A178KLM9_9GAMM|nr:putative PEP-binding protein [Photobacterium jeanii]OAN18036.1 phosphoenolpyruvate-utilizing protein [Photobacterium jeanii]PST92293.1 phosphoenolpyruvate-utilizing protein [Photobacterium jeanii]